MGSAFLQIFLPAFLLLNVFAMGFLAAIGIRHAREHYKPAAEKKASASEVRVSPALRERLLHEAEAHFQIVVNANAKKLERDLAETTGAAIGDLNRVSKAAVTRQNESYEKTLSEIAMLNETLLAQVRDTAAKVTSGVATSNADFNKKMESDLADIRERKVAELEAAVDSKLSDAVVSFLVESLGHDIDLGSQMKYILARLDENKDAIKAEVHR